MSDLELLVDVQGGTLLEMLRTDESREQGAVTVTHLTFPAGDDAPDHTDGRGVATSLTRAVFHRRAKAVACALSRQVTPGSRVLVPLPAGLDLPVALAGVWYAGCAAVVCPPPPPNVEPGTSRAEMIAGHAEVAAVLGAASAREVLAGAETLRGVAWVCVDEIDEESAEGFVPVERSGDDLALLQYAPGPTGARRGTMVSHANLVAQLAQTVRLAGLPAGANVVGWISPYHALGIGHLLLAPFLGGRTVLLSPEDFVADPLRWLRAISDTPGPVFGCAPNFAFDRCVERVPEQRRAGLDLSGWHTTFNAAERVQAGTIQRFVDAFAPYGFRAQTMAPGYGMTEAMLFITGRHADPAPLVCGVDAAGLAQGRAVAGTGADTRELVGVGVAGPHAEVMVVDPVAHTALSDDKVGEVWVRGPIVCQGYWQRPDLTDATFGAHLDDGTGPFLRTGDLGFWHEGELVLSGRCKELVIIRGRNLYPQDVEATCAKVHPTLAGQPAAAFSVDAEDGERLVVVQSTKASAGADSAELTSLAARLRAAVTADHEVEVHEVLLVEPTSLPTGPDGQIQRDRCRQAYLDGAWTPLAVSRRAAEHEAAASTVMRGTLLALDDALRVPVLVAELRRRIGAFLAVAADEVDPHVPLAGLGLESLRAIELRRDMERDLGVAIPIVEFMQGTVTDLAEQMAGQLVDAPARRDIAWRPVVADPANRHEPFPLTEQQYAYFVGRSKGYDLGEVSIHIYVEVDATHLDLDRLRTALNRLVAHQEMLRAVIHTDGTQSIRPTDEVEPLDIPFTDLTGAREQEQSEHLEAVRQELSHQVLPMDHWPMFEVRATTLRDGTTRVHVSLDLLVADVASVRLFFLEWGDFYRDAEAHQQMPAVSFRDYVLALDQVPASTAYERSRDYWLARIADLPPGPDLPLSTDEDTDRRGRTRRSHVLDAGKWARLRARAASRGVTPSVVQLAAFAEVLGRWSHSNRFTINVPLFNRMPLHPDIDTIIGDFTAVTLLEVDTGPDDGVAGLADRIQRRLWQDLEHRYFSGVEVMRELGRQRGVTPGTFATVIFASAREQGRDQEGSEGALGSAWLGETAYVVSQTPQVLFDHQVYEDHGALSFNWDVVEGRFAPVLDDMFEAYCRLLDALTDSDEAWEPAAADVLPQQHGEVVQAAHDTEPVPDELLYSAIARQAANQPDHTAVVAADATLTYRQLFRHATALGRRLRELGAAPNQLAAVVIDKSAAQVVAALAVQIAGAAYLPIDPDLPIARQDHLIAHGEVRIVLTRAGGSSRAWPDGVRSVVVDLSAEPDGGDEPLAPAATPGDLAYVLYTSGSTGTPKGVMLAHRATLNTLDQVRRRCAVGPEDVALGLSALSFDLSVWDVFGILGAGATLVLPEPDAVRNPGRWLSLMAEHGVTTWNSVPALAQMLVEHAEPDGGHPGLSSLRLMWLSGDWIPVSLPDRVRALAPSTRVVASGGPTETAIWCVAYDVAEVDPGWESIPYGRPLANHRIHVLDERLRPCPLGVTGEMYIGGAGLSEGYWRDPDRTTASFLTHPVTGERLYRSGDLGSWQPDGNLHIHGRRDQQVQIGGFRVEPGEIEAVLARHPDVQRAAVVAAGPDRHRRRLVAYVVPAGGGSGTAAGTELDAGAADKLLLGSVETDPVRRAEFTIARHALRRDLTAEPVGLPAALDDDEAAQVWQRRTSRRSFSPDPVPLDDLGRLLEGLRSRDGGALPKYRYASAGALYPVQVYLYVRDGRVGGLAQGTYYHDPVAHALVPVRAGAALTQDVHVSTNHDTFEDSAFGIFLVGRMAAIEPLYGSRSRHFCLLEAGQISQLLDDTAPDIDLGLCQLGLLRDEDSVREALDLAEDDVLLHSILGGRYVAAAEPAHGTGGPLPERLGEYLAGLLPHYLVPGRIVALDELPLSARGKVDRKALEQRALDVDEDDTRARATYAEPGSATERAVVEVIQNVLGLDRVGVDDRFFDLGADSVTLVRVYRALCTALGTSFPLMHMFEHPTVRRLAAGLDGSDGVADAVDAAFASGSRRRSRRGRPAAAPAREEQS